MTRKWSPLALKKTPTIIIKTENLKKILYELQEWAKVHNKSQRELLKWWYESDDKTKWSWKDAIEKNEKNEKGDSEYVISSKDICRQLYLWEMGTDISIK